MKVYLDNAATTPLSQDMKEYLKNMLDIYGNPSSAHSVGKEARQVIENARGAVRKFINANPDKSDILFTSGGSASNTLAIKGMIELYEHYCQIADIPKIFTYYSPALHKSALKAIYAASCSARALEISNDGKIKLPALKKTLTSIKDFHIKPFVVIEHANSEIGSVQPIKEIINLVHQYNGIVYIDCTGSISTTPIDVQELDVDMIGFSGHKIGALKGTGILYKKNIVILSPLIYGSQEDGRFGGTENLLGIASLGYAVANYDYSHISTAERDFVLQYLKNNIKGIRQIGGSLPHNLFLCIEGITGRTLASMLDDKYNIQISTGSACNSRNKEHSLILSEIGLSEKEINSCVRLSFSGQETVEELSYVCNALITCIDTLRKAGV